MARQFRAYRPSIEVSSNHRPDTSWKFIDSQGHRHQWYDVSKPATHYEPTKNYHVPSIIWIQTCSATDEYPEDGYYACIQCGDRVRPGYTADSVAQYIMGTPQYFIDDMPVNKDEFIREYNLDYPEAQLETPNAQR